MFVSFFSIILTRNFLFLLPISTNLIQFYKKTAIKVDDQSIFPTIKVPLDRKIILKSIHLLLSLEFKNINLII